MGELLTALAVIGISVSIAVPSFQTAMNNSRRTTAVNELVSTMHVARSEAITRNVQITVCPSASGDDCEAVGWQAGWIYFTDANSDRAVDPGEQVLGSAGEAPRLTITSAEFPAFLAYRPNGRIMVANPAQNSGQLTVCDPRGAEHARVLIIGTSGQPRLSEYQMSGAAPVCPAA
jgi:type IV fimbrial biogenesis protein FimT